MSNNMPMNRKGAGRVKDRDDERLTECIKRYADLCMFENYLIETPTSPGPANDTPFHIAAFDGNLDDIRTMLPYVDHINCRGDYGFTALHYAVFKRHLAVAVELLLHGADLHISDDYGQTALDMMQDDELFLPLLSQITDQLGCVK